MKKFFSFEEALSLMHIGVQEIYFRNGAGFFFVAKCQKTRDNHYHIEEASSEDMEVVETKNDEGDGDGSE